MTGVFRIIIGFIHDFAAGCWAATVLAVYWLERIQDREQTLKSILQGLQQDFFYIGVGCIVLVLISGWGRVFTYMNNVYGPGTESNRRRLLIIKHVVLFMVFGVGTYWTYRMAFY